MESVRDPNVDPPDHHQVWEAPSQYLLQLHKYLRGFSPFVPEISRDDPGVNRFSKQNKKHKSQKLLNLYKFSSRLTLLLMAFSVAKMCNIPAFALEI